MHYEHNHSQIGIVADETWKNDYNDDWSGFVRLFEMQNEYTLLLSTEGLMVDGYQTIRQNMINEYRH